MEQISFVIPFGDKKEERGDDEGVAATTFTLMGWTTEW